MYIVYGHRMHIKGTFLDLGVCFAEYYYLSWGVRAILDKAHTISYAANPSYNELIETQKNIC